MMYARFFNRLYYPQKLFNRELTFFTSKKEPPKKDSASEESDGITLRAASNEQNIVIPRRTFSKLSPFLPIRQAWVENLNTLETNNLGIVDLHPEIFGARPRIDLIYENKHWQEFYKHVDWAYTPAKHEIRKSTRKPWPQKGTGRARHGTRRSPIFKGGVKIFGPKGPKTYFYMLERGKRVNGLCSCLSVKLAQDDLHVVDKLNVPTKDSQYLLDLVEVRKWGPSVLFVDVCDIMPENIAVAASSIKHINLMPVYGLNVYSMLKHATLVLTLDAVDRIEEKLLQQLYAPYYQKRLYCQPT